jgi:hypothetical protein
MIGTRRPDDRFIERELADIRESVFASIERATRVRRRATIGIVVVGILLVGGGVTAGAIAIQRASALSIANTVVCYQGDDLGSRSRDVGQPPDATNSHGQRVQLPAADFASMCQMMWRTGLLGDVTPPRNVNDGHFPIPRLTFCRRDDGIAAGFPNRDPRVSDSQLCANIGLPLWTAG